MRHTKKSLKKFLDLRGLEWCDLALPAEVNGKIITGYMGLGGWLTTIEIDGRSFLAIDSEIMRDCEIKNKNSLALGGRS